MPETKSRYGAGEVAVKPKGARALFGAAMATVGALPPVITACLAILAALSEPPGVSRRK